MRLIVIGIGHSLRGDDSAGIEIVRRWKSTRPPASGRNELDITWLESPGLNLLSTLSGYQGAVLVDAVRSDSPPGTLHHLQPDDLGAFLDGAGSAHGWGVAETLKLADTLGRDDMPHPIHLLGIEIASVEPGQEISPAVQSAFPEAVQRLDDLVRSLLS